jgi:hypothetical protein
VILGEREEYSLFPYLNKPPQVPAAGFGDDLNQVFKGISCVSTARKEPKCSATSKHHFAGSKSRTERNLESIDETIRVMYHFAPVSVWRSRSRLSHSVRWSIASRVHLNVAWAVGRGKHSHSGRGLNSTTTRGTPELGPG